MKVNTEQNIKSLRHQVEKTLELETKNVRRICFFFKIKNFKEKKFIYPLLSGKLGITKFLSSLNFINHNF